MTKPNVPLPPKTRRAKNVTQTAKGWRILTPTQTRTHVATKVAEFTGLDGKRYVTFRLWPS